MNLSHAILLGLVQGLTEFLPISSSGHLVVLPSLLDMPVQSLAFDVFLHLGTSLAVIVYFYPRIKEILIAFFHDLQTNRFKTSLYSSSSQYLLNIFIACIPAIFFGLLLSDIIESTYRTLLSVAVFLTFGTFLMVLAELKQQLHKTKIARAEEPITPLKAFIIGLFQSFALFPGVSRSGASISGGMFLRLSRENAAEFSFLISLPVILGAGLLKFFALFTGDVTFTDLSLVFVGLITSFGSGYLAIHLLLKFIRKNSLLVFIVYRFCLALFLVLVSTQVL